MDWCSFHHEILFTIKFDYVLSIIVSQRLNPAKNRRRNLSQVKAVRSVHGLDQNLTTTRPLKGKRAKKAEKIAKRIAREVNKAEKHTI